MTTISTGGSSTNPKVETMFPAETLVVKGKLVLWYKYSFKIRHHLVAANQ
jgi:hypothetical protein